MYGTIDNFAEKDSDKMIAVLTGALLGAILVGSSGILTAGWYAGEAGLISGLASDGIAGYVGVASGAVGMGLAVATAASGGSAALVA